MSKGEWLSYLAVFAGGFYACVWARRIDEWHKAKIRLLAWRRKHPEWI